MPTNLHLGDSAHDLPPLEGTVLVGSGVRLALEAGGLRLSLDLDRARTKALLGAGDAFAVGPGEDPSFLEDEGVLDVGNLAFKPGEDGAFALEGGGTTGWGASRREWRLQGEGRVVRVEVEAKTEKGARVRLAEVLPAPIGWTVDAFEVPELGYWRIEAERA